MRLVLSTEAAASLEHQVSWVRGAISPASADRLRERVLKFLAGHLLAFPRTGHELGQRELWEIWIPGTRLVVWYRLSADEVQVAAVWHASQDRWSVDDTMNDD